MTEERNVQKIAADHLSWKPAKDGRPALKDVCLTLPAGEFYGILGPNGAGKTSLARQLLKLQKPDAGSVFFDNADIKQIKRDALARRISFLPQAFRTDVEFSVYEVVAMGREPYRRRFAALNETDLRKIEEALAAANCMAFRDKPVCCLSGGERQRVMIARTIAQDTPPGRKASAGSDAGAAAVKRAGENDCGDFTRYEPGGFLLYKNCFDGTGRRVCIRAAAGCADERKSAAGVWGGVCFFGV